MPHAEFHPPHGRLAADQDGFLFVEEYQFPEPETPAWTVFDSEGRLVGSFRLPTSLEILDVGPDYLLGLHRDGLGVEYLHLFDLERPS